MTVHDNLESVTRLVESLDVADGSQLAFTVGGRIVRLLPTSDVFANAQLTAEVDLERLRSLLRHARGPTHLADDPVAYAQEWTPRHGARRFAGHIQEWRRSDYLESHRPPVAPSGRRLRP